MKKYLKNVVDWSLLALLVLVVGGAALVFVVVAALMPAFLVFAAYGYELGGPEAGPEEAPLFITAVIFGNVTGIAALWCCYRLGKFIDRMAEEAVEEGRVEAAEEYLHAVHLILAGNFAQAKRYVDKEGLTLSRWVYVDGRERVLGHDHCYLHYVGAWRDRDDLAAIEAELLDKDVERTYEIEHTP